MVLVHQTTFASVTTSLSANSDDTGFPEGMQGAQLYRERDGWCESESGLLTWHGDTLVV